MNEDITAVGAPLFKRVILRFLRVFVSGGLAGLLVALAQAPQLNTLEQLKTWMIVLFTAFLAGGIGAIDKAFRG
jgi:hypothetical protein